MPLVPEETGAVGRGVWAEAELAGVTAVLRRPARAAHLRSLGRDRNAVLDRPPTRCVLHPLTTEPKADQGRMLSYVANVVAGAFV